MNITDTVKYIGVNDYKLDLFEGQYAVPNGMAYNSYVIIDEKLVVMDSVDAHFTYEWFGKIDESLGGKAPDYLVVQHMEPDHSGSLFKFATKYPKTKIVGSAMAFNMMKNFFGDDFEERAIVVGDGDILELGERQLKFVTAPMVHWPEVIMTYDDKDKILFTADAFGKFGTLDVEEDWTKEARRYYIGIVGKYGQQVQAVLDKVKNYEIERICPLHGPVLTENVGYYMGLYDTWSRYEAEEDGVLIAYTSVYGNTKNAVYKLAELLEKKGQKVAVYDLARCDWSEAVSEAFRYSKLVLATTTYSGEIFPFMKQYIDHLVERNYSNRFVGMIENGSWAPTAVKIMREMLKDSKSLTYAKTPVKILSALNEENQKELEALAEELCTEPVAREDKQEDVTNKKKYVCKLCGYVHEADELEPDFACPLCKRPASDFEEMK